MNKIFYETEQKKHNAEPVKDIFLNLYCMFINWYYFKKH
jgi:hypothetical protein